MVRKNIITIGNAGGYWGDDPGALKRQVEQGRLDYITIDFLAEVTMSILQKQRAQDPSLGYARDFIPILRGVLPQLLKNKTTLITNAGGVNPQGCADAIARMARELGLHPRIAVVSGDNILPELNVLQERGAAFRNMESGEEFAQIQGRVEAANVYFGAMPVVDALQRWQPDIVITGRVTDTGITVAPMIYEFAWNADDWNKIAAGVIAGHIIECGTQVTGGNFSDWEKVESFREVGFPIIEMRDDATFVVTKHPGSGGMVSVNTVREQLFYEMGDPQAYITPDVVADFSTVQLRQEGKDRVEVRGVRGFEPTGLYKVSMAYLDGYKAVGSILISGPQARRKAEKFAEIFWQRCPKDLSETSTEYLGFNACHGSLSQKGEAEEIVLRLGARSPRSEDLQLFGKMIPSLILSGPPGVAVLGGVPKVQTVISYWPALMDKDLVSPLIACHGAETTGIISSRSTLRGNFSPRSTSAESASEVTQSLAAVLAPIPDTHQLEKFPEKFPDTHQLCEIREIALARSGDKGDSANIGIIARGPKSYAFLKTYFTAQRIKNIFQEFCRGSVTRYELDNLQGLNFILEESLGGGGSCTLRADAQGKTFAQAVLRLRVAIPAEVREEAMRSSSNL
jgi:hypothetical protein